MTYRVMTPQVRAKAAALFPAMPQGLWEAGQREHTTSEKPTWFEFL